MFNTDKKPMLSDYGFFPVPIHVQKSMCLEPVREVQAVRLAVNEPGFWSRFNPTKKES